MEHHSKCQNCGRSLTEDELYCYFCEADLADLTAKNKNKSEEGKHGKIKNKFYDEL
ncbi:hypothetical protein HYW20_03480 [Candidatus Woesearchaeota archaeon]|nr:hypothetical protein [Candidatus Woesearchaeota archaeon]